MISYEQTTHLLTDVDLAELYGTSTRILNAVWSPIPGTASEQL